MSACTDHVTLLRLEDGAVPEPEAARIRQHLAECDRCRRLAGQLVAMHGTLAAGSSLMTPSSDECVDELTLAGLVDGQLPDGLRRTVMAHVADCHACAAGVAALVRELQGVERVEVERIPAAVLEEARSLVGRHVVEPGGESVAASEVAWGRGVRERLARALAPLRLSPSVGLAAAAALVLIVALNVGDLGRDRSSVRGGGTETAVALLTPVDGRTIDASGVVLGWEPVPGASSYTVTIVDARGEFFWQENTAASSIAVPAGAGLTPGARYTWYVEVLLESAGKLESPQRTFHVGVP